MDSFEFESGSVLENVDVEYMAKGTPKFDDEGNMTNVILYCHRFNGSYSSLDDIFRLTAKGKPFDFEKYYFISITSLGFPNSCCPSTTDLKHNFPKYTIKDRVNFKRQFLKERFNIENVHGVIGRGMGGYEAYTWACDYPDEMDFIICSSTAFKTNGYRYVVSKCMESIIESSDDFYSDIYTDSLSRMMVSINKLLYSNYFSKQVFHNMTNDEIDVLMDDFVDDGLFVDIYDFKLRNDAVLEYDVEDKLKNIKAKALIISSKNDMYYSPKFDVMPIEELIENSKIILLEPSEDYATYEDYPTIEDELNNFLDNVKNK
ncbi:MAG: alpha/beta fold hydrolase [Methanobrevibacter sp.]|nr:alpha/beta fold hydrolase [Methanobrevibacter sp.]